MANSFEDLADLEDMEDFPDASSELDRGGKKGSGLIFNLLSGCLVAATLLVVLVFAVIFINPQSMINPLPPPTIPILVLTDTPTPTPKDLLPPTWTATISPTTIPSKTPTPTNTPEPSPTTTETIPTLGLETNASFGMVFGSPQYSENTYQVDQGCDWMGVIGQVVDKDGLAVNGIVVEIGGLLGEDELNYRTTTRQIESIGEGAFSVTLSDTPQVSDQAVWIQLQDQSYLELSDQIYFTTYNTCEQNLIQIDFEQLDQE